MKAPVYLPPLLRVIILLRTCLTARHGVAIVLTNLQKKEDMCWRRGQNAENKPKKFKNLSMASERQLVQIQSISSRETEGWMLLEPRASGSGWIRLPRRGPILSRRPADQLHLYYTSEMDNLVLPACHFNGPLTVAAPQPPANPPRSPVLRFNPSCRTASTSSLTIPSAP